MNILKNKQYPNYLRLSRYSSFPYYYNTLDNKYESSTTAYLDNTTNYVLYQVKSGDTYDSLSLQAYGNPTYYWIICSYNHIQDPFSIPVVGSYLKIPVMTDIEFEVVT